MKKPMPWFRFYTEALDDPKVQRLPPHLFKTWVNLLCLAGASGGRLPPVDDIAFRLRMSTHDVEQQVDDLILAGLIDIAPSGQREPHNWDRRQFISDNSTERVRKHRKQKAETPCNTDETLHETPPDQTRPDPETESLSLPPEQDTARAKHPMELVKDTFRKGGSVSVEAQRKAAKLLGIADAAPLVERYENWSGSKGARKPDKLFESVVEGFYRDAPADVKAACRPLAAEVAAPSAPPPRASSALVASLRGHR